MRIQLGTVHLLVITEPEQRACLVGGVRQHRGHEHITCAEPLQPTPGPPTLGIIAPNGHFHHQGMHTTEQTNSPSKRLLEGLESMFGSPQIGQSTLIGLKFRADLFEHASEVVTVVQHLGRRVAATSHHVYNLLAILVRKPRLDGDPRRPNVLINSPPPTLPQNLVQLIWLTMLPGVVISLGANRS